MNKRFRLILVAMALVALAAIVALRSADTEPQYHGRPLSAWINDLRRGTGEQKVHAAQVLRESGPEAAPYLAKSLATRPSFVRRLKRLVGRYTPEPIKKPFRRFFDPTKAIMDHYAAAEALRVIGTNGQTAVPVLGEMLQSDNQLLSITASRALAQIGPEAVGPLVKALDHPDFNVRMAACDGIGTLGAAAAAAAPRLAKIVESEVGPIRGSAAFTLSRIGEPAVPVLLPLLNDTNWMVRREAAFALGYAGIAARSAEPALLGRVDDSHPEVRAMSIEALGRIDPLSKKSVIAADAALNDPEPAVRGAALQMLRYRPRYVRENIPRILPLLEDSSPEVRGYAALALSAAPAQAAAAIPRLEELINDTNAVLRASAKEALLIIRGIRTE